MLKQYLLGQEAGSDLSQVEERLMSDSNLYEELLIHEDELVDQYVHGQLPESDRVAFEAYFLRSQEHRQKVRFARTLNKYIERAQPTTSPSTTLSEQTVDGDKTSHDDLARSRATKRTGFGLFWPFKSPALNFAFAVTAIVAVSGISWLVLRSLRTSSSSDKVYAISLMPGGTTRDLGEIQSFSIPPGNEAVELRLQTADNFESYDLQIANSVGETVWAENKIRPQQADRTFVVLRLPAKLLKRDTYRIRLQGHSPTSIEHLSSYTFRITD